MLTALARSAVSRLALVALVLASLLLTWTVQAPAAAEVVSGSCTGTVTIDDSIVLEATQPRDVPVEVPGNGSFVFVGSIDSDGDAEVPVPYSGELRLLLPIGSWPLEDWSGETTDSEVVASGGYALPGVLPGGTGPIPFEVVHIVGGEVCRIVVSAATPGSTWDPVTIGLLVITLLLVAAMFAAGRRDTRGRGRPLVGLVAGLLGGLTAAATLFGAAGIALDSAVWWILPAVLAALGLLLGAAAPFGRDAGAAEAPGADTGGAGGGAPDDRSSPDSPSS
ncbi:MAG: hypothetical protein R6V28_16080 [Nitriliruptoraceae bacterium]